MIPSTFVFLEELPRNANGKLDRRRLPAPGTHRPDLATPFVEPETPLQVQLAAIWSEVLKVNPVGIHDNFFALGGHSLSAAQIVARIAIKLGAELPLSILFDEPTVERLSAFVSRSARRGKETEISLPLDRTSIPRRVDQGPCPLSFGQERLWFLSRLDTATSLHFWRMYRLEGD
jgi:acyl carrier protein